MGGRLFLYNFCIRSQEFQQEYTKNKITLINVIWKKNTGFPVNFTFWKIKDQKALNIFH